MLLFLALLQMSYGIYYEQFYADATCSGPVLYARRNHALDSFCTPTACRATITGLWNTLTCIPAFISLGVDEIQNSGTIMCRGGVTETRTYPRSPACGNGAIYTCSSDGGQINELRYSNITCGGALTANNTFPTNFCIGGASTSWRCTTPGTTTATTTSGGTSAPGMAASLASVSILVLVLLSILIPRKSGM